MASITGNRLGNFGVGELTRRDVVRGFGVSLAAAAFGRGVFAGGFAEKTHNAIAVNHISYQVEDYAKTRDFYASLLGMTPYMDTGKQCNLGFGDTYIVVHNRRTPVSQIDHVAYTIENWDINAVVAELKAHGLDPKPVGDNPDSVTVKDLDGIGLQISGKGLLDPARKDPKEPKKHRALDVNHVSYQVEDYAKTRDFYASLLGMKPYLDTGKTCNLLLGDSYIVVHNRRTTTSQIDHVAYTISDWDKDAVEAELRAHGLDPKGVGDNPDSFTVKDPDGIGLQISGKGIKPA